jgi:1-acyl-sn-glycerol-3-phosphate acyltransferase
MMQLISRAFLRLAGWRVEGATPDVDRYVMIAAPHTSNWDLPYMLAVASILRVRVSWMGKQQIFRWPFRWVMRKLGGIPVRRDRAHNMVDQMVAVIRSSERIALAVPPEGTRGASDHWRSGFYHIALGAGVPVVTGFLDYARKVGGVGPTITLSGDPNTDMDAFRDFYEPLTGKHPGSHSTIRLKAEM